SLSRGWVISPEEAVLAEVRPRQWREDPKQMTDEELADFFIDVTVYARSQVEDLPWNAKEPPCSHRFMPKVARKFGLKIGKDRIARVYALISNKWASIVIPRGFRIFLVKRINTRNSTDAHATFNTTASCPRRGSASPEETAGGADSALANETRGPPEAFGQSVHVEQIDGRDFRVVVVPEVPQPVRQIRVRRHRRARVYRQEDDE